MTSPIAPLITDEDGEDMDYHAIASGLGGEIPNEYVPETLSESIARILVPQLAPVVKECSPKPVLSEHITPSLASEGGVPGQTERRRSSSHSVSTRRGSNGKRITSMSASAQDELDSTLSELKMVPSSGSGHTEFARVGRPVLCLPAEADSIQ